MQTGMKRVYASGGFQSLDGWWVQLMADVLQKPMLVNTADADASAMGAITNRPESCRKNFRLGRVCQPVTEKYVGTSLQMI